jgi:hypothetical protein
MARRRPFEPVDGFALAKRVNKCMKEGIGKDHFFKKKHEKNSTDHLCARWPTIA